MASAQQVQYLHGRGEPEVQRLELQNRLFRDQIDPGNLAELGITHLFEPGCGYGIQTEDLLTRFPHLKITACDIFKPCVDEAQNRLSSIDIQRWRVLNDDVCGLQHVDEGACDGAFVCFTLEHTKDPAASLREIIRVLKPQSPVVFREVFQDTLLLNPACPAAIGVWNAMLDFQIEIGGHPNIGGDLSALLPHEGFEDIDFSFTDAVMFGGKHDPTRLYIIADFLKLLMERSVHHLIRLNKVTKDQWTEAKQELQNLMESRDPWIFYSIVRAAARSPG